MDILSARKKAAAERARLQKKNELQTAPMAQEVVEKTPPNEHVAASQPPVPTAEAAPGAGVPEAEAAGPPIASSDEDVEEQQVQEIEMLSFRLGGEDYALMVDDVKEVLKNRELTPVPNAPDYVLGVMALRGPILPVMDLCKRLGIPSSVRDEKSRILVMNVNDEDMGIIVDRVNGVVRLHPDSIRPVPETVERGGEFLRGIARKDDKLYILLDLEKAFGT